MSNQLIDKALAYLGDDLVITKRYTYSYSLTAAGTLNVTGALLEVSTPSGYIPFAITQYQTGNTQVVATTMVSQSTGDNTVMILKNMNASTAQSGTCAVRVAYMKSGVARHS